MFKKIKVIALSLVITLGMASFMAPAYVSAQDGAIADSICDGVLSSTGGDAIGDATACQEDGENNFSSIIKKVINIFSIVIGAVSVIMIIIGGFRYIISGGDQNSVTAAKNTIMYAIIGLVIVLFSQVIVKFVLSNALKSNS